ncbi:hypothetical protein R1sor_003433 [Riccia sorocarpa]|uniref:Uncharacterized protein n=1 Tax=Riccia sorocarpa TaxID=122646 RepID=A0ABD3H3R1_9MARC
MHMVISAVHTQVRTSSLMMTGELRLRKKLRSVVQECNYPQKRIWLVPSGHGSVPPPLWCSSPVSPSSPSSPTGGILEVAPPRLISISKQNFSARSLATIIEDSIMNEKALAASTSSVEQFDVPQLVSDSSSSTVRTTSSDLPMLHRQGKEPMMVDQREQYKSSGLSAEFRRIVQTQANI